MMSASGNDSSATAWLVRRRFKIPALGEATDMPALTRAIEALPGVHEVRAEVARQRLVVHYAASKTDYRALCAALTRLGYAVAQDRWSALRGAWYQFTDNNVRENAQAPAPACCNKPPRRKR